MAKHDLESLRKNSESISDYLSSVADKAPAFEKRKAEYEFDEGIIAKLREVASGAVVVAFSAEWCKDCHRNIPVLDLISEKTGLEVRVFGHLMRDTKSPDERWSIPPSPPEVKEFDVVKIPLIFVLNGDGEELGKIVENPPEGEALEESLLKILRKA